MLYLQLHFLHFCTSLLVISLFKTVSKCSASVFLSAGGLGCASVLAKLGQAEVTVLSAVSSMLMSQQYTLKRCF